MWGYTPHTFSTFAVLLSQNERAEILIDKMIIGTANLSLNSIVVNITT